MAAPPVARAGTPAQNAGRWVVAGVGPHERVLGARTTSSELWTALRSLLVEEVGLPRLQRRWGSRFDRAAHRRFSAFVSQAEAFYLAAEHLPAESRPLVAYYSALNLTKAFLSCAGPSLDPATFRHGIGDGFEAKQRYWFVHETAKVHRQGVFRELARRTGAGFCHPTNKLLTIQRLAPYLVETADIYEDAVAEPPRLVPLASIEVWTDKNEVWLRAEADPGELRRRALGPASLPNRAKHFGRLFRHVQSEQTTASYESIAAWSYGGKRVLTKFPEVKATFEKALVHSNRGVTGARRLLVISERDELLSQEAVAFAVLHHLCNMVRYRPEQVAKLSGTKWFFLFNFWVPRALENYLLAISSRILHEEMRIG